MGPVSRSRVGLQNKRVEWRQRLVLTCVMIAKHNEFARDSPTRRHAHCFSSEEFGVWMQKTSERELLVTAKRFCVRRPR